MLKSEQGIWVVPTYTPHVDTRLLISRLDEKAAVDRYRPELKRALAKLPGTRHTSVEALGDPLKLAEPAERATDALKDLLDIRGLDLPDGIDGYGFVDSAGEPTVFIWSKKNAVTIHLRAQSGRRFCVKVPGELQNRVDVTAITVTLSELNQRPLRMGSVDTTVSDGIAPVEVYGLSIDDTVVTPLAE